MPQSHSCVLVHFAFSTKNRRRLIEPEIETELYPFLGGVFKDCDCPALAIGGTEDHLHILCRLAKTVSQAEIMEEAKTRSSKWIKSKGPQYQKFYWQAGYGAFSIGQSQADVVKRYIARQKQHHKKVTFQEEYLALIKKYDVEFDERYMWD